MKVETFTIADYYEGETEDVRAVRIDEIKKFICAVCCAKHKDDKPECCKDCDWMQKIDFWASIK